MHLRDAVPSDADLLAELLLEAYNWTGQQRMGHAAMLADPHARRYLDGWMRPRDLGVVAVDGAAGSVDQPALGAAWLRTTTRDRPGYGYVADDVPELSMAVRAGRRGAGLGGALLAALLDRARASGTRAVSLSVEDGNDRARALYERHGFGVVGRTGGSDTMLLVLAR
ncbi:GNAT family N-acetyltransferase [uncultured Cellulomonas sp.]|uniref:GNAT family N-acetyltransferase n=1 Tax=uncultured Cellulomonas sp. TaxID=189682 RepID=UPI00262A50F6|nr:GNAT family N-acetyltransferase [uncultured Cellulomonas sp.]